MPNDDSKSTKRSGWRHAFAVDRGKVEPTEKQREVVDRLAREVVRRHLTTPALAFLEMSRPLNYITAHTLHFFHPIVRIVTDGHGYRAFAEFLEHRGSIDFICSRIEALEAEAAEQEKAKTAEGRDQKADTDESDVEGDQN